MNRTIICCASLCLLAATLRAGDVPETVKTLSDAELYLKARMAKVETEKETAIAKAREEIERRVTLKFQAELADLKRQLIFEKARAAELQEKLDDVLGVLKAGISSGPAKPTPARWGKAVFADDFSGPEISDAWAKDKLAAGGHSFTIMDGMLTGKERLETTPTFSGKAVRVEYDTWTLSDTPCDASVYLENASAGASFLAGIGGEMNQKSRIQIDGTIVASHKGPVLVKGKRQHMVVEVGEGRARIEVDGRTLLEYEGEQAPAELKDVVLAVYSWQPGMHFDNIRVYAVK